MADSKISALSQETTPNDGDLIPFAYDVTGTPATKAITLANLAAYIQSELSVNEINAFSAREEQTSGTAGGTFTAGSWTDRTINALEQLGSGITLSSNEITLPAGKWILWWAAPAYNVNTHQSRVVITGTPSYLLGRSAISSSVLAVQMDSQGVGIVDESSSFTAKVQHRCQVTEATNGLGFPSGWGTEVYAEISGIRIGDATP